ncbi:hypothetical protein CSW98_00030 [Vibrio sp. HA2012]|uniref:hypothetical protein n=1 Tax=Vibrio sp. HA2012 TaxID=1971595 RepID=UPI000C2B6B2F|nr:hypothetical protein [Vibrio sp. HA2012]PJC87557.1 hypothetical protein CSW98_00030 [Vibrio sp. HA2012]
METTPYSHFTVLADGEVGELTDGFECPKGMAIMSMNIWALNEKQSVDVCIAIGKQIGFQVSGEVQIYQTEPSESPGDNPFGYGIKFTPYEEIDEPD